MTDHLDDPTTPATTTSTAPAPPKKRGGGPRTPEGRQRSRRNALRHGLRSKMLLPDDLVQALARRTAELDDEFRPRTPYANWLVGEMALASARLDRCAEMMIIDVGRGIHRALYCWDDDRRMAVEGLGARLARDPSRVSQALRGCSQGADWLIGRWKALGTILKNTGTWTEDQRRLAFDMLGVDPELRQGSDAVPPPDDAKGMADLVAREVAQLRGRKEAYLDRVDRAERAMAADGMPLEEDLATARLRKYEASCRRTFNAAKAELLRLREAEATADEAARPLSHKTPLSDASVDYLAKRARFANQVRAEALKAQAEAEAMRAERPAPAPAPVVERPAAAPTPVVERPTPAPGPAPSRPAMVPASSPMNRRERRAQAKRDRQAARRAASGR